MQGREGEGERDQKSCKERKEKKDSDDGSNGQARSKRECIFPATLCVHKNVMSPKSKDRDKRTQDTQPGKEAGRHTDPATRKKKETAREGEREGERLKEERGSETNECKQNENRTQTERKENRRQVYSPMTADEIHTNSQSLELQ